MTNHENTHYPLGDLSNDELETVFLKTAEEVARRKSGRW